ncbi:hypothetical protein OTU49_013618, partial [Cherax quadricarinatus]
MESSATSSSTRSSTPSSATPPLRRTMGRGGAESLSGTQCPSRGRRVPPSSGLVLTQTFKVDVPPTGSPTTVVFPTRTVSKVLEWLSLPTEQRPDFISLYFDEPDRQGHATGPDSPELNQQLQRVDKQISTLMAGLAERDLLHCVNILLVADHGMANADPDKVIKLEQYVPEISEFADVFFGASGRIRLKNHEEDVLLNLTQRLSCQLQGMRVFRLEDLPKRLHYSNNRRLDHLVLDLDPGYNVQDLRPNVSKRPPAKGQHGYDYYNAEMNGLFVGYGADLQQGLQVEPFQNIELYNLMCILASVTPAPNNGSWGSLHHLLADPPAPPESIKAVEPPAASYTKDGADTPHNTTTGCAGDAGVIQ